MEMQQFGGWWLPAGETHLPEWMEKVNQRVDGRLAYQHGKLVAALGYCRRFRRAIDVGGHIGTWSFYLAKLFQRVEAFEPVALHRECFDRNVGNGTVHLWPLALGAEKGSVSIRTAPTSSGDSWVEGSGDIPLERLDDLLPDAVDVDFIKLDCEGYELFALQGAEQTILRNKPAIIVEQKRGKAEKFGLPRTGAVSWLQERGAVLRREIAGDYILSWN